MRTKKLKETPFGPTEFYNITPRFLNKFCLKIGLTPAETLVVHELGTWIAWEETNGYKFTTKWTTLDALTANSGLSKKTIQRAIKNLEDKEMITKVESNNSFKYNLYNLINKLYHETANTKEPDPEICELEELLQRDFLG